MILAKAFCLVDELNLSSLTRTYLKKNFASDEEVIQCGRSVAYENNLPKWKAELVSALNQAGFIRPETDFAMYFRIRLLYQEVYQRKCQDLATYLSHFTSKDYESFIGVENKVERVKLALHESLSDRDYDIISRKFGLDYEACQSFAYIGHALGISESHVRLLEKKATRRLRNSLPHFLFVASKELNEAIVEFADLQRNSGEGLAELNLSVRTYNCLRRNGIDTILDIINFPKESWSGLRKLGRSEIEEINDKMKKIGYDFNIGQ